MSAGFNAMIAKPFGDPAEKMSEKIRRKIGRRRNQNPRWIVSALWAAVCCAAF